MKNISLEKSMKYDRSLVESCMAGPNALYLTEELTNSMEFQPEMLILDLGCGKALSSVFLAREFGVSVYAVDLQVHSGENYEMIQKEGLTRQVFPLNADAAALPIMPGMLDGMICVNAYHNFGMVPEFFKERLKPLLKPGAQVGLVLPATDMAFAHEITGTERPAFWTMSRWKSWFEPDLDIQVCEQLSCTEKAWNEWIAVSSPISEYQENIQAKLNPKLALVKIVGVVRA